ncbi:MAG: hypothetical protein CXX83_00210 [Methanobacteriota archaeon]|nr:MAG: hypothetical protein CXX83_00210 [Euryarchaeota archaeon]
MVHEEQNPSFDSYTSDSMTPKASRTGLFESLTGGVPNMSDVASGRVYGIQLDDPRSGYVWLQKMTASNSTTIVLSRLSPQRLGRWISLESIEFHWLSSANEPHAIEPALERLHHLITTSTEDGDGIIWLDAVEYLGSRHGFDALMNFVQSVGDSVAGSGWTVILPYNPLAFEATQVARLRREAVSIKIDEIDSSPDESGGPESHSEDHETKAEVFEVDRREPGEDEVDYETAAVEVEPGLLMLSRIPLASLSRAVLQRRLEQWQSMGFDVGELEPVLLEDDRENRHNRYLVYEEKVRRAVECERRIRELESLGFNADATKLRFRIMQLTGLDDVELRLERLLAEAR